MKRRIPGGTNRILEELGIPAMQIDFARDPRVPLRDAVADQATKRFVGRPYFVWKDDPDLARAINDKLLGATS